MNKYTQGGCEDRAAVLDGDGNDLTNKQILWLLNDREHILWLLNDREHILEAEKAQLKAALTNIQAVAVNNLDHDMHRVYKMCDEALEATK